MASFYICCPLCANVFDEYHRLPCTGDCPHYVCKICLTARRTVRCPICSHKRPFRMRMIQGKVVSMIRWLRLAMPEAELNAYIQAVQNIDRGSCTSCGRPSTKLLICADCKVRTVKLEEDKNTWRLPKTPATSLQQLRSVSMCHTCSMSKHLSHNVIPLRSIENIADLYDHQIKKYALRIDSQLDLMANNCDKWKAIVQMVHIKRKELWNLHGTGLKMLRLEFDEPTFAETLTSSWEDVEQCNVKNRKLLYRLVFYFHLLVLRLKKHCDGSVVIAEEHKTKLALRALSRDFDKILENVPNGTLSLPEMAQIEELIVTEMRAREHVFRAKWAALAIEPEPRYLRFEAINEMVNDYRRNYEATKTAFLEKRDDVKRLLRQNAIDEHVSREARAELEAKKGKMSPDAYTEELKAIALSDYIRRRESAEKQLESDEATLKWLKLGEQRKMVSLLSYHFFDNIGVPEADGGYGASIDAFINSLGVLDMEASLLLKDCST